MRSPLVETRWLADRLRSSHLVVVDCTAVHRVLPEGGVELKNGLTGYQEGHIPGAVFADLLADFTDPMASKPFGTPSPERVAAQLEKIGVSSGDTVVLYDRAHTAFAAWVWWQLQSIGFEDAFVLNGGWARWVAEGRPVSSGMVRLPRGTVVARPRPEVFATRDQVIAAVDEPTTCLINSLGPDQHAGRVPVAHGRSGHIPTSINVPALDLVESDAGTYHPWVRLAGWLAGTGATKADRVITYCAAGPNAASVALVLTAMGIPDVAVYEGGLVEWGRDPDMPLDVAA